MASRSVSNLLSCRVKSKLGETCGLPIILIAYLHGHLSDPYQSLTQLNFLARGGDVNVLRTYILVVLNPILLYSAYTVSPLNITHPST